MPGPARATSSIRVSSAVFAFIYKKAAQASDDGSHLRAHGRRTRALSRTHPAWLFVLCWRGSTEPSWRLDGPSRCPSRLSLRASSEIGRASCRERVWISVVAVALNEILYIAW